MTLKISASDKISSLGNHNYRIRQNKDLVGCSFSSLSNSLKMHFPYFFFRSKIEFFEIKPRSFRGLIKRDFSEKS